MPRELAEQLDSPHSSVRNAAIESLRRILAAPVVERQEAVATILCPDPYDERQGAWMSSQDLRKLEALPVGTKLYTSPPAPVLPERKQITGNSIADVEARAHNACLDKVKELNQ
jgi:hypothetical protein